MKKFIEKNFKTGIIILLSVALLFTIILSSVGGTRGVDAQVDFNSPEFAKWFEDHINEVVDRKLVGIDRSKRYTATVTAISGGSATVVLASDSTSSIVVQNPNEIPLEIGDQVSVLAIGGSLSNSIIEFRKGITIDEIYVDYNTGTDSYGRNSAGKQYGTIDAPFRTLQYAVNRLPKNLNDRKVTIYYSTLLATESVLINGLYGGYYLNIVPLSSSSITNITSLEVRSCIGIRITIESLGFTEITKRAVGISKSNMVVLHDCEIINSSAFDGVVVFDGSIAVVEDCTIENQRIGILVSSNSQVYSSNNNGFNTQYGLMANYNSTIGKNGTQCTGGIENEFADESSIIR